MLKVDTFKIVNKNGIHARPSASFVKLASQFQSNIYVEHNGETIDGKSIIGVLMLAAAPGDKIKITAEGTDADKAIQELGALVKSGFNEE